MIHGKFQKHHVAHGPQDKLSEGSDFFYLIYTVSLASETSMAQCLSSV